MRRRESFRVRYHRLRATQDGLAAKIESGANLSKDEAETWEAIGHLMNRAHRRIALGGMGRTVSRRRSA